MKRYIIILLTIISFSACSLSGDDDVNHHFEYVPITEVDVPSEFILGERYQILVKYSLPNDCYGFYSCDYIYESYSRMVTIIAAVNDDTVCTQTTIEGEYIIDIEVVQSEPYIFKFWQGIDNQGNSEYLIVEVPVF